MTEKEWLACNDPRRMLEFLRGSTSDRKLRLFICAYYRNIWHWDNDDVCRDALEMSENFADGLATREELEAVKTKARAAAKLGHETARFAAIAAASNVTWAVGQLFGHITTHADESNKVKLLHDLWGPLPFRQVCIYPCYRTPNVVKLAQSIYDDRAFDRLPVLADALEEAGPRDADILGHCRGPGPHVRGCWVLDLILGKA